MSGSGGAAFALVADRLVDGAGRSVDGAVVTWEGSRITGAGPRARVPIPAGARVLEGDGLTVLPGLVDAHVHLGNQAGMNYPRILMTQRSLDLFYAVPNCAATLAAGFTTVRDAGLTPASVRAAVERGLFPGPRMRMAVSILSQTGGHGDEFLPCGVTVRLAPIDIPHGVVDGPDGMRHKVREVLRAGADWVKLCTSGGILSPDTDAPDAAQFTTEEIAVAVQEAAAHGKRCMAHAMSAKGVKNALLAGVASIEHGCFLDEEGIALMLRSGAYLVPTLVVTHDIIAGAEREPGSLPATMVAKARAVQARHREAITAAARAGVRIAMGTDTGVGEHGANGRELALMVGAGLTPMEAITASTRTAAELLGMSADVGTLEVGKLADLVAVRGDPLAEIALLGDPSRVAFVVKGGRPVEPCGPAVSR